MTKGDAVGSEERRFKTLRDLVEWVAQTSMLNGKDPLDVRLEIAWDEEEMSLGFHRGMFLRIGPTEATLRANDLSRERLAADAHRAIDLLLSAKGRP